MSWLPGFGHHHTPEVQEEVEEDKTEMDEEFEEIIDKYAEIIEKKEQEKDKDEILYHFTVAMPLFEVFLFNRSTPASPSQVFCRMRMHEIFFQRSYSQSGRYEYLFSIDDVEIVNEFTTLKRFEIVFKKKPRPTTMTEDESDEFLSRVNSDFDDDNESVDTDGLSSSAAYKSYTKILNCNSSPPLFLLEYAVTRVSSNQDEMEDNNSSLKKIDLHKLEEFEKDIKLSIQHFELYLDRLMIGTILNNFVVLEDNYQHIRRENTRLDYSEDENLNTSKSSINVSMRKEKSSSQFLTKKEQAAASKPFKSISVNIGGMSFYVPDTLGFEQDTTQVLCLLIGETKIFSGKPESPSANLLLEDENENSFAETLNRNNKLMKALYGKDSSKMMKLENKYENDYQTYMVTVYDVNCLFLDSLSLLLSEVPLETHEALEEYRILQNFDIKLTVDTCLLAKSEEANKQRVNCELGHISLQLDRPRLALLIEYYSQFMLSQQKMSDKFSQLMKEKVYMSTGRYQSVIEAPVNNETVFKSFKNSSKQIYELNEEANEDSKLIDDASSVDDDEQFFDALDEHDKGVYNVIKNRPNADNKRRNQFLVPVEELFNRKLILIAEIKSFSISLIQRREVESRGSRQLPRERITDVLMLFKLQLSSVKLGFAQTTDSISVGFLLQSFFIRHMEDKIVQSKIKEVIEEADYPEENKSNRSFSNNNSTSEVNSSRIRPEADQF